MLRENRRGNQEWTLQRHWQHWVHKKTQKTQKTKKMSNTDTTKTPVVNSGTRQE